ncbi:hypothetical protein COLO4_33141 [Corchorus olitorius]|uniref:G-patch domain-containing protein n=1 Tax=Corchorus olitorius TaxID=93759 RepID=A0A1R3GW88_9ROSI|nr:hypothetical protein COLO4_33141 [Corchorus olitorius]
MGEALGSSGSTTAIDSSNIGFKLLKKHGWKEGTGLGISEQGRLEPVQAYVKNNKRGLGAEKNKRKAPKTTHTPNSNSKGQTDDHNNNKEQQQASSKKAKALSKRLRKMVEQEKRLQETEFERAFRREFWPDNV